VLLVLHVHVRHFFCAVDWRNSDVRLVAFGEIPVAATPALYLSEGGGSGARSIKCLTPYRCSETGSGVDFSPRYGPSLMRATFH